MDVFCKKVSELYQLSKNKRLPDLLWKFNHKDMPVDKSDSEYISWQNSLPILINEIFNAGLQDLDMVLEYETPIGGRIDAVLIGTGVNNIGLITLFELKQWSFIKPADNLSTVQVPLGSKFETRNHPLQQLITYKKHLRENHSGLNGSNVNINICAFLHNFGDISPLITGEYEVWSKYKKNLYNQADVQKLRIDLKSQYLPIENMELLHKFVDGEYTLGDVGFSGLKKAMDKKENAVMIQDQTKINSSVYELIKKQRINPKKQLVIVSGGPGTGKTIIGFHFIYDFFKIFNNLANSSGAVYSLPRSRTIKDIIYGEAHINVPYTNKIPSNIKMVVVDEAHRFEDINKELAYLFERADLVILLQDDYQRIRITEQGTKQNFINYAKNNGIDYSCYELVVQKRSGYQADWIYLLDTMFYGKKLVNKNLNKSFDVSICNTLDDLNDYVSEKSQYRTKFIAPFCWNWSNNDDIPDITINNFKKFWNPRNNQYLWYKSDSDKSIDEVASIYTSQGLEFDYTALIWWNDLVWDKQKSKWIGHLEHSCDKTFVDKIISQYDKNAYASKIFGKRTDIFEVGFRNSQQKESISDFLLRNHADLREITLLIMNTYRILLTRAKKSMAIWFHDDDTKDHVSEFVNSSIFENK